MSIHALAAKAARIQDQEPELEQVIGSDAAGDNASGEGADTPATTVSAEEPAVAPQRTSMLRRGPVASPSAAGPASASIMDEAVDSSFASALADDSIEKGIADAVDGNRPTLDDDEPAPTASGNDDPAEPAAKSGETTDNASEEGLDHIQVGPGPFLNLSGLTGLGNSHDVLVELLSSAMNRDDAVAVALEYNNHLQTEVLPAIEKLNLSAKEKEEMRKRAEAEAARQATGGGGVLSGLFSALGRALTGGGDEVKFGKERRRILGENSGFAQRMAARISDKVKQGYVMSLHEAANAGEALTRAVNSYNAAVFDAPECADIKQAFLDRAQQEGLTPAEILRAVTTGAGHADLAEMVRNLPEGVESREDVMSAAKAMRVAQDEMHEAFQTATRHAETMQKNIYDGDVDLEKMRDHLKKAMEVAEDTTPRPVDQKKAEELKERMAEIREAIEQGFRRIISAIEQALGAKPK